jgi:hypothetical protein
LHQRVVIWKDDGSVENVEADQSYFLTEVNHATGKTFEKNLAKIVPCSFVEDGCNDQIDTSSVRLDPIHGFIWEKKVPNTESLAKDSIPSTGQND